MSWHRSVRRPVIRTVLALLFASSLAHCGGSSTSPSSSIVLVQAPITLQAGVNCNNGGTAVDFQGTAGKTVVIQLTTASSGNGTNPNSAASSPRFTLYAPDYATQLGSSTSTGLLSSSLTITLTQTGVHHVSVCDANGVGGSFTVTVTQQ